ncbi:MAG: AEC family transporter [Eubacteriales bacterium]|nr:AEC family transporter [Eubacteriales bacterium]
MELAYNVGVQVIIIFILMTVGFALQKFDFFTPKGIKQMTNLLLNVVSPCVLIEAYQKEFQTRLAYQLLWAVIFTIIILTISVILGKIIFRKEPTNHYRIDSFASTYSNCGFMAIPLLSAVLGSDGVFFGSGYLAMFTLFYWTIGVYVMTENKKDLSIKKALLTPGIIGALVALLFFFTGIKLPEVLGQAVHHLANLNTPLSMVILGTYLVNIDFKKVFTSLSILKVCFVRLILIPIISIGVAVVIKLDPEVAKAVLISSACPTAAVTTLFATKFGLDADYSSQLVSITTLLSIVTIPAVVLLCSLVIQ